MTSPPPPKLKQKKIPATSQSTKIWKYNTFLNSGYVWLEGVWMVYFSNYPYFTFITGKALLHAVETIKSTISLWRSSSVSI